MTGWLLLAALLLAFCLPQGTLPGGDEAPRGVLVLKQSDFETIELEKCFEPGDQVGAITWTVSSNCPGEVGRIVEGPRGFCLRRLLCLFSRGPPAG